MIGATANIPVSWFERKAGKNRFRILALSIPYLRWYFFAFATTWLRRGPETMKLYYDAPFGKAGQGSTA